MCRSPIQQLEHIGVCDSDLGAQGSLLRRSFETLEQRSSGSLNLDNTAKRTKDGGESSASAENNSARDRTAEFSEVTNVESPSEVAGCLDSVARRSNGSLQPRAAAEERTTSATGEDTANSARHRDGESFDVTTPVSLAETNSSTYPLVFEEEQFCDSS